LNRQGYFRRKRRTRIAWRRRYEGKSRDRIALEPYSAPDRDPIGRKTDSDPCVSAQRPPRLSGAAAGRKLPRGNLSGKPPGSEA